MPPVVEIMSSALLTTPTTASLRPRFEGSNICTWIGFKHVNYLVEEAVLEHFRAADLSSRRLFEQHGLGLDVVELDTRIRSAFHLDDVGVTCVVPTGSPESRELTFAVTIVRQGYGPRPAVTATARVTLRRERYIDATGDVPVELAPYLVEEVVGRGADQGLRAGEAVLHQLTTGRNAFGWRQRIPYPYCHFNERMQMSGYLRQMEAAADLFLADRGISIRRLLDDRRWIPVVPHSRIRLLDDALMEEDLYTVYAVQDVFKDLTYQSSVDTYVVRDGRLVHTATGVITHGYARIENRRDWRLVNMDSPVLDAIRGNRSGG